MAQKITDPATFLRNLVVRKGTSDRLGVYLTSVNVVADAQTEYDYEVKPENVKFELRMLTKGTYEQAWNSFVVNALEEEEEIVHSLTFPYLVESVTLFLLTEGNELSCSVFLPKAEVSEFPFDVIFFQALLKKLAKLTSKYATNIRFHVGLATIAWDDMVEQGHAQEVEIPH